MIGRGGKRGSGISVQMAQYDDDDLYENGFGIKYPTMVDMPENQTKPTTSGPTPTRTLLY